MNKIDKNEQPKFTVEQIVDIMCPAKHDGTNYGLLAEMLVAKVKYINNHKFTSLEEERQWMVDYITNNYKKHLK